MLRKLRGYVRVTRVTRVTRVNRVDRVQLRRFFSVLHELIRVIKVVRVVRVLGYRLKDACASIDPFIHLTFPANFLRWLTHGMLDSMRIILEISGIRVVSPLRRLVSLCGVGGGARGSGLQLFEGTRFVVRAKLRHTFDEEDRGSCKDD